MSQRNSLHALSSFDTVTIGALSSIFVLQDGDPLARTVSLRFLKNQIVQTSYFFDGLPYLGFPIFCFFFFLSATFVVEFEFFDINVSPPTSSENTGLFDIVLEFGCKTELRTTGQRPCIRGKSCDKTSFSS